VAQGNKTDKAPAVADDTITYSVPHAGRLLGLSRNSSYDAAARGELPTVRIGGRILVPRLALHQMLDVTARQA
jgi:excisionase family DNA binding protein